MYARRRWHPDRRFFMEQGMWAAGSLCLALTIWAFLNGPHLQAQRQRALAVELQAEDRAFCSRLGRPYGSRAFIACASELDNVRWLQKQRMERDADLP